MIADELGEEEIGELDEDTKETAPLWMDESGNRVSDDDPNRRYWVTVGPEGEKWGVRRDVEKSLSPRNIPAALSVLGLRAVEERFAASLAKAFESAILGLLASRGGTEADWVNRSRDRVSDWRQEAETQSYDHINEVYRLVLKDFTGATFTADDDGAIEFLSTLPRGLIPTLKGLSDEVALDLESAIRDSFADPAGVSLDRMIERMEEVIPLTRSRLERIARTETSRTANLGRVTQWQKYLGPGQEIDWIVANPPTGDARTCDICKAIAMGGTIQINKVQRTFHGNPYRMEELQGLVPHLVAHPNERCVVARRVE